MISFLPCEEENKVIFTAVDGGKKIGSCAIILNGYDTEFVSVECDDDIITEGLARSAMNYAANRMAYIAKIKNTLAKPAFIRLGFEGENMLSVEIPQALTSGCSCNHNKSEE